MVQEYDKLQIPERYKEMSIIELEAEKRQLYQAIQGQNKGEVRNKIAKSPIIFRTLEKK